MLAGVDALKADDPPQCCCTESTNVGYVSHSQTAVPLEVHAAGLLVFARQPGGHEAEGGSGPRGVPVRHPVPVERVQVCAPQQEPGLQ